MTPALTSATTTASPCQEWGTGRTPTRLQCADGTAGQCVHTAIPSSDNSDAHTIIKRVGTGAAACDDWNLRGWQAAVVTEHFSLHMQAALL